MAVKTKAQVQALFTAVVALLESAETYGGTLAGLLQTITDAIAAGDDQPEDKKQTDAVEAVISAFETTYTRCVALFRTLHKTFGRYAGSTDLANRVANLQALHDKLVADSESITSRGLTKFSSWSAAGGNTGDGEFVVYNLDVDGTSMDISHIETLTATCTKGVGDGATTDGGEFKITGAKKADRKWSEGGSSTDLAYEREHGQSVHDWASAVKKQSGATINSVGASTASGNILNNGDFEGTIGASGSNAKIPDWPISSGEAELSAETAAPSKGAQSIKAGGDFLISQSLVGKSKVRTGRAYRLSLDAWTHADVDGGTMTIKVLDDSTTHATVTHTFTSLTDATWTTAGVSFVLPYAVGANLRVEIEVAGYSETAAAYVAFDRAILYELQLREGRAIGITTGRTDWIRGDNATGATSSTDAGTKQKALNRHESFWVEHAGSAVGGW